MAQLTGTVQVWMVYALALAFGVVSGFFMPAAEASLPRLLRGDELEGGNALMMGADSSNWSPRWEMLWPIHNSR